MFVTALNRRNSHRIITNGLKGWWKFDEGTGTTSTADSSDEGNDGTLVASPSWVAGAPALGMHALEFNGSTQYVSSIGSTSDFNFIHSTGKFSISFWAEYDDNTQRNGIAGNTLSTTETGFFILREVLAGGYGDASMRLDVCGGTVRQYIILGTTDDDTAESGSFDHWTVTADKSVSNIAQWYKNGVAITTTARNSVQEGWLSVQGVNASRAIDIANVNYTSVNPNFLFNGTLDDVRIYNRALSADEISRIYKGNG